MNLTPEQLAALNQQMQEQQDLEGTKLPDADRKNEGVTNPKGERGLGNAPEDRTDQKISSGTESVRDEGEREKAIKAPDKKDEQPAAPAKSTSAADKTPAELEQPRLPAAPEGTANQPKIPQIENQQPKPEARVQDPQDRRDLSEQVSTGDKNIGNVKDTREATEVAGRLRADTLPRPKSDERPQHEPPKHRTTEDARTEERGQREAAKPERIPEQKEPTKAADHQSREEVRASRSNDRSENIEAKAPSLAKDSQSIRTDDGKATGDQPATSPKLEPSTEKREEIKVPEVKPADAVIATHPSLSQVKEELKNTFVEAAPNPSKSADQMAKQVSEKIEQPIRAVVLEHQSNEKAAKALDAVKEAIHKPDEVPTAASLKEQIRRAESDKEGRPVDQRVDKPAADWTKQIIERIQPELKALAIAGGGGGGGNKKNALEDRVEKVIEKIGKELESLRKAGSSSEDSARALEAVKRIIERAETITIKQLEEISRILNAENAKRSGEAQRVQNVLQAQRELSKIEVTLRDRIPAGDATKLLLVDRLEKELRSLATHKGSGIGKAIEAVKDLLKRSDALSVEQLQAIIKTVATEKPTLPMSLAKSFEEMTRPPMTKQEAMQAILGILVDAKRLASGEVKAIKIETDTKLSLIVSNVDELLKLRVDQYLALSAKHGLSQGDTLRLLQETLQELATRFALTDEQRALLANLNIIITKEFQKNQTAQEKAPRDPKAPDPKAKVDPAKLKEVPLREATKEEIERAKIEELKKLEEQLKEREEVRARRAEKQLKQLMKEEAEPDVKYLIDESLEVIKVVPIRGRIISDVTGEPMEGVLLFGGKLLSTVTDFKGEFIFDNVPVGTAYIISPYLEGHTFVPEFFAETLTMSVFLEFTGRPVSTAKQYTMHA